MTKEKAIEILTRITNNNFYGGEVQTACRMGIEALSTPSLPSNLDEAAQKVEDYYDVGEERGYLYCHRGDIKDAFEAGAEWMAGQGVTIETPIYRDYNTPMDEGIIFGVLPLFSKLGVASGDKAIVQIRKKP